MQGGSACGEGPSRMNTRGFSMIEVVMVMAVIAILALIAVPSFLDRNVRLQVQEGMQLAEIAEKAVGVSYLKEGELPASNEAAKLPPKEKIVSNYVSEVSVDAGAVTITFGNNVNSAVAGKRLTRRPAIVKDTPTIPVSWLCNNAPVPKEMTVMGENRTDIPNKWLPVECRS